MHEEDKDSLAATGAVRTLWQRAPWWRTTLIAAGVLTVAAIAFKAEDSLVASAPTEARVEQSRPTPAPLPVATMLQPSTSAAPPSAPAAVVAAKEQAESDEETLAACHPHLAGGPHVMPQIDVAGLPQPNLGHIKLHLWVNGAGVVVRDMITESSIGTPAEQQAEIQYAKQLTFSLPNTRECRSREVEILGDVFEARQANGAWATYVRLYPRLYFNSAGVLQHDN
jgi:hypothetical protein